MSLITIRRSSLLTVALTLGLAASSSAQLERSIEAHGGRATWDRYAAVEFDQTWTSAKGTRQDHQLFDLRTRDGLITSDRYTLGAHDGEVWIKPDAAALGGTPPRFYMWTPFYFFGMPFVFADPGAVQEALGKKEFQGKEYDVVKVTYKKGTGDTPDDFYVAYVEPASGQLKLAAYVVTYPALRKGRPIDQLEMHALVFEEWQEAGGLQVPKAGQFYVWKDGQIEGEPLGRIEFANVRFEKEPPPDSKFAKPEGAVRAPME